MFEGIIAKILNKYLSEYIDAVDYKNLNIGLFSGSVELKNIKIKPSALFQFDLPIDVKYGTIGKLKINLSWRKIMSEAAVLEIEDLFVLCGPFEDKIHDPNKIKEIHDAYKRKKLTEIEKIDEAGLMEDSDDEQSYTEQITNTIINNIQVYIKNIHIRYEDNYSIKNRNVSFGLFLKEFRAETVDSEGRPNFLNAEEKIIYKQGILNGFNFYWNADSTQKDSLIIQQKEFSSQSRDFCVKLLKESIDTGKILGVKFEKFLEKNLDLEARLILRRDVDPNQPKIIFQSFVNAIDFCFQRTQYKNIITIVDCYSLLNVHKQFVKYRPQEINKVKSPQIKARLLWKFAFEALAESKWRSYKRERMLKHWRFYKEYVKKYGAKLKRNFDKKPLAEQELKELEAIEAELSLESILEAREYCNGVFRESQEKFKKTVSPFIDKATDIVNKIKAEKRPKDYVELRMILNFPFIGLRLINRGFDILRFNFTKIESRFEYKPVAESYFFLINTRSVDAFGIYYKDTLKTAVRTELVPLIRSKKTVHSKEETAADNTDSSVYASETAEDMFFTLAFETNPINIQPDVEFSVRTRVQSLEIYYEKTCITELLNFFKSDTFGLENVVDIKKIQENVWSKAGVIFAVENHKQFHVSAELSSPYFIIPGKGTMQEPGNSIVFFLGKTLIQSDLHLNKKVTSTTDIIELEKNFYDKLKLSVNEVQVILVPPGIKLEDYLVNCDNYDYKYHLLYPVSTDNIVYISIDPKYKKLPKLKVDATCPSIRLNFSDNKIIKLFDFAQNFPLPTMPKYAAQPAFEPATLTPPAIVHGLNPFPENAMGLNSRKSKRNTKKLKKRNTDDETDDDEWDGPFASPKRINGNPVPNYCQILLMFKINDFVIDIKGTNDLICDDPVENEYLGVNLKSIKLDFSLTKYGFALKAGLGNLRLLDKVHRTFDNQFTEFLSSSSTEELIQLRFRNVEPEAPNFESLYSKTLSKILFKCNRIQVVCHRTAIIYFINFGIKLTGHLTLNKAAEEPSVEPTAASVAKKIQYDANDKIVELNIEAIMNELTWKMFDNDMMFGNMQVSDMCATYCIGGIKTDLQVKLKTLYVNYENTDDVVIPNTNTNPDIANITDVVVQTEINESEHTNKILPAYKQIISCTAEKNAENFFDFRLIFFDTSSLVTQSSEQQKSRIDFEQFKDSIYLNIGKIKVICLVKFVNELINFIEPIINPLPNLATQIKDQAIEAANMVKNVYQESQTENKHIFLNFNLSSPLLIIPQNSVSLNGFLVLLGNLTVKNQFIKHTDKDGKNITIDEINLDLKEVEVKRIKYRKLEPNMYHERESIVAPINLTASVQRTLTPSLVLPELNISLEISNLDSSMSLISLKLLFAILDENLNEGAFEDLSDPTSTTEPINRPSLDPYLNKPSLNDKHMKKLDEEFQDAIDGPTTSENKRVNMELHVLLNEITVRIIELKICQNKPVQGNATNLSGGDIIEKVDFSLFRINQVDFDYFKYTTGSWDAELKLRALRLQDTRPDSNLSEKEMLMPLDQNAYFIELLYKTMANGDATLTFKIDHLRINLCLPYILKLYQIAMDAISAPAQKPSKKTVSEKTSEKPATVEPSNSSLRVKAQIRLPEVVLFAEPEKPDSKILLMKTEIGMGFSSKDGNVALHIDGNVGMRLGEYNNAQKQGIAFLSPCDFKLKMVQKKGYALAFYTLKVDSLIFNMTPTLYQCVMGVINTINKSGTETKQIESVNKKLLEDSEPFKVSFDDETFNLHKKRKESRMHSSQHEDEEEGEDNQIDEIKRQEHPNRQTTMDSENKLAKLLESLDMDVKEACIKFCEESSIDLQPLAIVRISMKGKVSNWTKNLHVKAIVEMEAIYYNDKISNWEPLVEQIMIREDEYRPWAINLWFAIEEGGVLQPPVTSEGLEFLDFPVKDLDYSVLTKKEQQQSTTTLSHHSQRTIDIENDSLFLDESDPKESMGNASFINIESNDMLNLNLTPSAYKVIMYLAQITTSSEDKDLMEGTVKQPFKFFNFLGKKSTLIVPSVSIVRPEYCIGFEFDMRKNLLESDVSLYHSTQSLDEPQAEGRGIQQARQQLIPNNLMAEVDGLLDEKFKFVLDIEEFERVNLTLKTDGSYLIALQMKETRSDGEEEEAFRKRTVDMIKYNIMFRIRTNYGRKKVIFSSPLQIENKCKIKLLILVELTDELYDIKSKFNFQREIEMQEGPVSYGTDALELSTSHNIAGPKTRRFAVLFELLPSKIFYVPLYFAYNCRLYIAPQNLKYFPSLVFDIRGWNLGKDDIKEVNCKRLPDPTVPNDLETIYEDNEKLLVGTNDIGFIKQRVLNVKSYKNVMPSMHANYKVMIFSPLKLINTLPFKFRIDIDNESTYCTEIKSGESLYIHLRLSQLTKFQVHVSDYLDTSWVGKINWPKLIDSQIENERLEMVLAPTNELLVSGKHLTIYINYKKPNEFTFYSPYWLLNKTGQQISLKSSDSPRVFNIPDDTILLFDFKDPKRKNEVQMNINWSKGAWSDRFSIDTAGTTQTIDCHNQHRTSTFLMRVTISDASRAKLVTFAPYLSVANQLEEAILFAEWNKSVRNDAAYDWKQIEAGESLALSESKKCEKKQPCRYFMLKTADHFKSKPFPLENPGRFVLITKSSNPDETIPHKIFTVLISDGGSLNPTTIIVRKYQYGDSVAKFVNLCQNLNIDIKERSSFDCFKQKLHPYESFFFVWLEFMNSGRELVWNADTCLTKDIDFRTLLTKSGSQEYKLTVDNVPSKNVSLDSELGNGEDHNRLLINNRDTDIGPISASSRVEVTVTCVSYIDGTQRIILFTTDSTLAEIERKKEAASMEIYLSLKGMQISLINNVNLEIASVGITDSMPCWTLSTSTGAYKVFTKEQSSWLDRQYREYMSSFSKEKREWNEDDVLKPIYEIHFDKMQMNSPERGQLKRYWRPGMKVQYRTSTNLMSLKCAIYKIQIDNQLPDAYFPICFYKTPTNLEEKVPINVPFLVLDMFTEQQEVTQIYRHFNFLLQEFYLKVDKGFLFSIKDWYDAAIMVTQNEDDLFLKDEEEMIEPDNILVMIDSDKEMIEKIKGDIKLTRQIMEFKTGEGNVKQSAQIIFDSFKLSSIIFNLSFSVNGTVYTDDKEVASSPSEFIFYFLLESIGSTISEFKDVKFHFNQFEIDNQAKTWNVMYNEIFDHFKIQVLHQAYVLIFGLDVLGNPFGLVSDFSKGITDLFYDPLIAYLSYEENQEHANINFEMRNKIKTTVNKIIASSAGSGSLITGSVGRMLATISFDKEYKRKRQYKLSKSSTSPLDETLTLAGKNVVAGLVYGVTGIVKNPITECKISKKGIFKGIGKGISGFVVKPAGSLFDGISISLDGIRRFAQSGSEPITSMRQARHLIKDIPIKPYSGYLAEGYAILRELQNDNIAEQEAYWAHYFLINRRFGAKDILYFITDAKIYQLHMSYTQILAKWKQSSKPIPLNKIDSIVISPVQADLPESTRASNRVSRSMMPGELQKKTDMFDLTIKFPDGEIFDRKKPNMNKKTLITSDRDTVDWLKQKIECGIKYHKEVRLRLQH